ncbi:MAG: hypothetical protein ABEJ06_04295 [Haloarculaceae archaeon]
MSVIDTLKGLVSSEQEAASINDYECQNCGNTLESMKDPAKAKCMECLSADVEQVS